MDNGDSSNRLVRVVKPLYDWQRECPDMREDPNVEGFMEWCQEMMEREDENVDPMEHQDTREERSPDGR